MEHFGADGNTLVAVNRSIARLKERDGVRLSSASGEGVAWVDGSRFGSGTIDVDVRGKDVPQGSFLGVAFHRKDDATYESVYLRPFNFRAGDAAHRQHAVQYIAMPDNDFDRLRRLFPGEFEGAVDPSNWPQ